jgi:phospholipid/cholesterol/gamma-HCH transport system ATP-binding protein
MAENLNITSIVVTHDIHSVLEIAEKVAFLENQGLCWYGTVDEMRRSDNEHLMDFITASEYQIRN